jgi:chromosome segregation ATPase
VRGWLGCIIAAGFATAVTPWAHAEGIYTCVDAKGRRLTSDRPIIDCIDREQAEISPNGQVLRKIGPSLTAEERAAEEEKAKRAAEERNRQFEQKKRDRALLSRYPDRAAHDKERNQALASVDEVIKTANKRIEELHAERRKFDTELEFYKGDLAKAPAQLKRRIDDNEQQVAAQKRFIANQEEEKRRINARYDQELQRLNALWTNRTVAPSANRSSSSAAR